jgi:hypothetical protein
MIVMIAASANILHIQDDEGRPDRRVRAAMRDLAVREDVEVG